MIDPRGRRSGSTLGDTRARRSEFLAMAQQMGFSNPPTNAIELMKYLQQFLTPQQMELVRYMFLDAKQFQMEDNVFGPGLPEGVPTVAADIPPAADNAAAAGGTPQQPAQPAAPQTPQTPAQQQPAAQPAPQAATATPKPAAEPQITKVAQPRLDRDPDDRIRMFMKDGSQTYWDQKSQTTTPTAERVNPNQAVRYTIKLPNGETQNIY